MTRRLTSRLCGEDKQVQTYAITNTNYRSWDRALVDSMICSEKASHLLMTQTSIYFFSVLWGAGESAWGSDRNNLFCDLLMLTTRCLC